MHSSNLAITRVARTKTYKYNIKVIERFILAVFLCIVMQIYVDVPQQIEVCRTWISSRG